MAEDTGSRLGTLKRERPRLQRIPVAKRTDAQRKRLEYLAKEIRRLESQ